MRQLCPAIETGYNTFPLSILSLAHSGLNNHIVTGKVITGINTIYPTSIKYQYY